jgi:hypothetical protein
MGGSSAEILHAEGIVRAEILRAVMLGSACAGQVVSPVNLLINIVPTKFTGNRERNLLQLLFHTYFEFLALSCFLFCFLALFCFLVLGLSAFRRCVCTLN